MHGRTGRFLLIILFVVLAGTYILFRRTGRIADEIGKPESVPWVAIPDPLFGVQSSGSSLVRAFTRSTLAGQDLFALAHAANQLPDTLNHGEQAALIHFLLQGTTGDGESGDTQIDSPVVHHEAYIFLANQVMDALLRQRHEHPMMTDGFISMWQNVSLDPIVRDYALQHLGTWLHRHATAVAKTHLAEPGSSAVNRVIETLFAAAQPGHGHSSGTALLALHHASTTAPSSLPPPPQGRVPAAASTMALPLFNPQRLQDAVHRVAMDPTLPATIRCTAFQIAAQRGSREVLPEARRILASTAPPPQLAASAAALVGALGDLKTDGPGLLIRLGSADPLIAASTKAALTKLELKSPQAF